MKGTMCVMMVIALSLPVAAELGGDEVSIAADQVQLRASIARMIKAEPYTMYEIQAASGTTVREYVSSAGTVFAVSWQGPSKPDLKQLLGSYFDELQSPFQSTPVRRGPIVIRQSRLVFEMGGHMRSFAGRAYIPQLLPTGISADAVW
jgi:hypothetical protein